MTTVYKPIEFAVDCLIAQGLYILAGAPKIGKSWMSLDIGLSVAKGEPVLGQSTKRGTALYLCLEDNFTRIQNRLYQITDEPTDELYFAVIAESIGSGLEEQIECFKKQHENLRLVFIDTFQMVRSSEEIGYFSDYKELTSLKNLADSLQIAIVLVHHTRKSSDDDPFNMISGSTGLSGCVDGSMVLLESKRGSRKAVLHCIGRDIENREIELQFDSDIHRWIALNEPAGTKEKDNPFLSAVFVYMQRNHFFIGTASELIEALKSICDEVFYPNRVTRELILNGYELEKQGIKFEYKRTHRGRKIILQTVETAERDSSDSKNIAVTTVALPPVKSLSSPFNIIEDLYYGRIAPYEVSMTATPEFEKLKALAAENEDLLRETLSDEQKEQLEKLTESVTDISSVSEREMFIIGFRLGVKLMIDVLK